MKARPIQAMPRGPDSTLVRAQLAERLRSRREEIETAVLTRVNAIADPSEAADPAYAIGLRGAVRAAVEYDLEAIEAGDRRPLVPVALLAQARLAARNRVGLDVVLRRYTAGFSVLGDFVLEEAIGARISGEGLKLLLAAQAALLDCLTAVVGEEYARESELRPPGAEGCRAELVERLLAGERADSTSLAYELDLCHLGMAASPGAAELLRGLSDRLDCRMLLLEREDGVLWAWIGTRRTIDPAEVINLVTPPPAGLRLALGEPAEGIAGWRLTHRQALAALSVSRRGEEPVVRYADLALLASAIHDDLLLDSLAQIYMRPLRTAAARNGLWLETLRAYVGASRNASSAAAALGVSRRTVANRLRAIESALDKSLDAHMPALEAALSLDALERSAER